MKQFTLFDLHQRMNASQDVKVTHGWRVSESRCGVYLTLRTGLVTDVFFVGRDLENDKDIVELV